MLSTFYAQARYESAWYGLCVQEGALDLLKELKAFNMTLKLLQVGSNMFSMKPQHGFTTRC